MLARVPFRIDRTRQRALVRQMTDGIRDAIVTGYYKPGDRLPTIHEWTHLLDVSIRVPEGALANLVKEGYVVTRPRQGCMVMPRDERRVWRGHVLFVRLVDIRCHFVNEEIFAAEEKLSRAGYLVTIVVVRRTALGPERVENLERETCREVDGLFAKHGRKWLPDVIYVEDDYQAIGALFSLMSHGVKMPDDVRFATVKNYGHGPALPISLTRVEFNFYVAGAAVGKAAVAFLNGEGFSYEETTGFNYIIGESFPDRLPSAEIGKRRRARK